VVGIRNTGIGIIAAFPLHAQQGGVPCGLAPGGWSKSLHKKEVRITTPVDFFKINVPSLGRRGNLPNTCSVLTSHAQNLLKEAIIGKAS
jgi:hypothetical protein